jgi:hypothetical protein
MLIVSVVPAGGRVVPAGAVHAAMASTTAGSDLHSRMRHHPLARDDRDIVIPAINLRRARGLGDDS